MKNKAILVSLIAFFAIVFAMNLVAASNIANINEVRINGIIASASSTTIAGDVSDTIPVEVQFVANQDVSDVKVKVYIEGYKDDISAETTRFHIVNGSQYIKRFSLRLPSTMDLDNLIEKTFLTVEISAKGEESVAKDYVLEMQRDLYSLNVLSVESPDKVLTGNSIPLDIVLQNNGNERLDNVYVKASIPELGVVTKVYFGDLSPSREDSYEDITDTISKRVYLAVPRNSKPGVYNIEIEAYNYDTSVIAKNKIVVSGIDTGVLPSMSTKTIKIGEETQLDVILVNSNDRMVVYSISPEESKGLTIGVSEPVVTVAGDSSRTVKVSVKANANAEEGTHLVTLDVNSETGAVKQVMYTVNVEKSASNKITTSNNMVFTLTVILVIIFVVLLIVLIVLLTKKPSQTEEFGETSYY